MGFDTATSCLYLNPKNTTVHQILHVMTLEQSLSVLYCLKYLNTALLIDIRVFWSAQNDSLVLKKGVGCSFAIITVCSIVYYDILQLIYVSKASDMVNNYE